MKKNSLEIYIYRYSLPSQCLSTESVYEWLNDCEKNRSLKDSLKSWNPLLKADCQHWTLDQLGINLSQIVLFILCWKHECWWQSAVFLKDVWRPVCIIQHLRTTSGCMLGIKCCQSACDSQVWKQCKDIPLSWCMTNLTDTLNDCLCVALNYLKIIKPVHCITVAYTTENVYSYQKTRENHEQYLRPTMINIYHSEFRFLFNHIWHY